MITEKNPRGAGRKKMDVALKKRHIQITLSPDVYQALRSLDTPASASQVIEKALRLLLKI